MCRGVWWRCCGSIEGGLAKAFCFLVLATPLLFAGPAGIEGWGRAFGGGGTVWHTGGAGWCSGFDTRLALLCGYGSVKIL